MTTDAREPRPANRSFAATPPYTAYVTFDGFVRRAAGEPIPPLVDKGLLIDWGIATGNESGLVTSLKGLGIVDEGGRPTELYHQLRLSPPRRAAALRRSLELAYPGLDSTAGSAIDPNQLHDYFVESRGLTGQMVDKACRFYLRIVAASTVVGQNDVTVATRPSPSRTRPIRLDEAQLRLETIEPATPTVSARRSRARPPTARRGAVSLSLNVQVVVPESASESDLTELFSRIQSAWVKSLRRPSSG